MKVLIRFDSTTALAVDATEAFLSELSKAVPITLKTDYDGLIKSVEISPRLTPTLFMLTDAAFELLTSKPEPKSLPSEMPIVDPL